MAFVISITNHSTKTAENIKILDLFPDGVENPVSNNKNWSYDPFAKKMVWNIDEIRPGETIEVHFSAIIGSGFENKQLFNNTIQIIKDESILKDYIISGVVEGLPDFSASIVSVEDINGGKLWSKDILKYEIILKNTGKNSGKDLILSCPVPAGTGYVENSATGSGLQIKRNNYLLEWNIEDIPPGEARNYSFKVFVADYMTFEEKIISSFFIINNNEMQYLDNPLIMVSHYAYNTIVCMGDSEIVLTEWPGILDGLLEQQYPHGEFNTIATGVRGEFATDAVNRFDADVRFYEPEIIVLGYGANDAGEDPGLYKYHMDILIRQAISTGAKVFVHGVGYIDTSIEKWEEKRKLCGFK